MPQIVAQCRVVVVELRGAVRKADDDGARGAVKDAGQHGREAQAEETPDPEEERKMSLDKSAQSLEIYGQHTYMKVVRSLFLKRCSSTARHPVRPPIVTLHRKSNGPSMSSVTILDHPHFSNNVFALRPASCNPQWYSPTYG